ncbi:hypothetical protein [Mycobacteroides immunogenum]|uniref:hypothetical protein n=1 Tax=Mycobacteroides immunogenum TaxID=83262 RepID=UPI000AA3DB85|nr:hypothetical protein [Mycobacteroides immunogenum]
MSEHIIELSITERRDLIGWLKAPAEPLILGNSRLYLEQGPELSITIYTAPQGTIYE